MTTGSLPAARLPHNTDHVVRDMKEQRDRFAADVRTRKESLEDRPRACNSKYYALRCVAGIILLHVARRIIPHMDSCSQRLVFVSELAEAAKLDAADFLPARLFPS